MDFLTGNRSPTFRRSSVPAVPQDDLSQPSNSASGGVTDRCWRPRQGGAIFRSDPAHRSGTLSFADRPASAGVQKASSRYRTSAVHCPRQNLRQPPASLSGFPPFVQVEGQPVLPVTRHSAPLQMRCRQAAYKSPLKASPPIRHDRPADRPEGPATRGGAA